MSKSLTISFEFFPPKTEQGENKFRQSVTELAKLSPHFFSVTFGAGGSTREGTISSIKTLQQMTSICAAPHVSCMGASVQDVVTLLAEYKKMGVKRIVALRGDMPSGMGQMGELRFASDLVKLIRDTCGDYFHIEVAAYPEVHPQAKNAMEDLLNLKRKIDNGANSAITQYFYNADAYFYLVDNCAKLGMFMPIVPGIMPITQFSRLVRFSDVCGAEVPRWIQKQLEAYGDDIESIRAFGHEVVYKLCQQLIDGGAPGFHFYTLNHFEASAALVNSLSQDMGTHVR